MANKRVTFHFEHNMGRLQAATIELDDETRLTAWYDPTTNQLERAHSLPTGRSMPSRRRDLNSNAGLKLAGQFLLYANKHRPAALAQHEADKAEGERKRLASVKEAHAKHRDAIIAVIREAAMSVERGDTFGLMPRFAALQWLISNTYPTGYSRPNPLAGFAGAIKVIG